MAGVNPFDSGSRIHTDVMKTPALRQALDKYGFDAAIGGARRDEEKSRAKERVFSLRSAGHRWDPKAQRPEPWRLFNTRKRTGESFRVSLCQTGPRQTCGVTSLGRISPSSHCTSPRSRPIVEREGALIMRDDDRMRLRPGERVELRTVRFRTLGCYPLTGAIESDATTVASTIVAEMRQSRTSERQGRIIDHDGAGSMEAKKQEGYFSDGALANPRVRTIGPADVPIAANAPIAFAPSPADATLLRFITCGSVDDREVDFDRVVAV